ncbi:DUF3800 domain-containing protein [Bradyrhizobium sp. SZCCHNS2002]|uniref:DUF3800 domain-containing protein n=1 Tax=Bradyrhizobium sp. SZCCHNS2002 TaxID=3057302 RepID=UPI0029163EE4|nr:DUF3800 domain-containing protein [Bradyrhizobium sp. SZCCHNS2002]
MITAYFDDSGTHGPSEVVIVAGIFATEARTRLLERRWRKLLADPLEGRKPPLKRFHMFDCYNSIGEFTGWTRTETDYLCHLVREELVGAEISSYGVACPRKDWDELVTGDYAAIFGNAEGFCIRNCFVRTLAWAGRCTFDPDIRFVFDARPPGVVRDAGVVHDAYEKFITDLRIAGISFESSLQSVLLQAADYVAWEFYTHVKDLLASGKNFPPNRPGFRKFVRDIRFEGQFASREAILEMAEKVWNKNDKRKIAQIADHFRNFDPKNPDYSHLDTQPDNSTTSG